MKKKVLSVLILLLAIITCGSCVKKDISHSEIQDEQNKLEILKSDIKLTQEQVMSQIKADYLIKNDGYKKNDEIIMIVELEDDALIDIYNKEYSAFYDSVATFATSTIGREKLKEIDIKQKKLIAKLTAENLITDVETTYSTIMNAVCVKAKYSNLNKISNTTNVSKAILSETYNLPKSSTDASAITNDVDVYETGIFNSSSVEYTGNGTAVAVLDSGFDCSHTVFKHQPSIEMITQQDVSKILASSIAGKTTKGLELSDVYYSRKIPFVYDYADKDPDVFPYDSEHGTHVAGIIGGYDDVITGIAIDTQLVLMKVFPDLNEGGKTEDILCALEDAVLLGVDAINMSLGSSCGFSREVDKVAINEMYDKLNESGISLITAASNSYSSSYGGAQGNTNFVTNPDSGTVGSPSTYPAALSVASISGTKSKYLFGNDSQVIFFKESNSLAGKENDFFKELGITDGVNRTYEYVTVPGVGLKINYANIDVKGKIALVRRGDNTFEEKALNAKNAGAIACIIYNNIDGDIIMSMGKTEHIPTISISKDDGTLLASKESGKLVINFSNQAGPFMSDFSSWGPTPSLEMKPEITAHGGNIKSSVPGGGYDDLSGTSMATPNLCGIVVLIRQYLKEKYPTYTTKEISVLTNQLLMSTANTVLNEQGNPYSPRKQGAGLASLYNAVNTSAYITVEGKDRPKIELFDDPKRNGVYNLEFTVNNLTDKTLTYDLSLIGMTESVSTSDPKHVSEKSQILDNVHTTTVISGGTSKGDVITINPSSNAVIKVVYTLTSKDKTTIDTLFPYGMYVEGFVKLLSKDEDINLSVPFLGFYGDWCEAPLFDKTYYEVEKEAHNMAIDDEDKIKADYYATTPYGSYFYNYIIPLGTYLYDIDENQYDAIPASLDHIAISNTLGTIDGIGSVYAGLLRNAKEMSFEIKDKLTGEVIWTLKDYNAVKAYAAAGSPIPYYNYFKLKSKDTTMVNNREYEFNMVAKLDYRDGGLDENVRNSFSFDFVLDDEAPVLEGATYEKIYDKTQKKDRYYVTLSVYDNHYVQSITPIIFTSTSSYTFLSKNPIPVYSEKGETTKVRFEITDYLEDIFTDKVMTSALGFSIDDYALNSNIYLCQLPGTKGDFKFTKDGTVEGSDLVILSIYENDIVDLTKYLSTKDETVDDDKSYLDHLVWTSSNEKVALVEEGLVRGLKKGRVTITVREAMNSKQAVIIINVKEKPLEGTNIYQKIDNYEDATIENIRFSYFDTLFAYSRAAQTSEIGETGDKQYISASKSGISFYPGEKIQLYYDLDPWYVKDKYKITYKSTNETVATIDQKGVITGLKEGSTYITLSVEGSNLMARIKVTIKSEFVIENRTLIAYKGLGGEVVIPDDEGILYIGSYAFCLFETDRTIELTDDDYDANKIPSANTSVTKVVIPKGVTEIQKYAFYNCSGLKEVIIPDDIKIIREYAFCKDEKLEKINLENIQTIGKEAFKGCKALKNVSLDKIYSIGVSGFEGCESLTSVDLSTLRNTGQKAFKGCTSLKEVVLTENTKLAEAMFVDCALEKVDIYERISIPTFIFARCKSLKEVTIHNDIVDIAKGAFSECTSLTDFNILSKIDRIEEQAFYASTALETITLPNNDVAIGNYAFYKCSNLKEVVFKENTKIIDITGSIFEETKVDSFKVDSKNPNYIETSDALLSKDGKKLIFIKNSLCTSTYKVPSSIKEIGYGAFCGADIKTLIIENPVNIGNYAFANAKIETIEIKSDDVIIGKHAFNYNKSLTKVDGLDKVNTIGDYAFANTSLKEVSIKADAEVCEGAFFTSKLEKVTVGKNVTFGLGAFQNCYYLKEVNLTGDGVHFGVACFANDKALTKIDLSKTDDTIEKEAFYGCKALKAANLVNVKTLGDYVFADCGSLNYVNAPIIENIGEGAFGRYDKYGSAPSFTEINLPTTLKTIGDGAFLGCNGLLEITLPSSIEKYGNYLFTYCANLQKVTLPENMTEIGEYDFSSCVLLSSINLGNIKKINKYAFTGCEVLKEVDLKEVEFIGEAAFANSFVKGDLDLSSLKTLEGYVFQNTYITSFNAPKLESIGDAAFQGNKDLKEVVIYENLTSLGHIIFLGCSSLENICFGKDKVLTTKVNDNLILNEGVLYKVLCDDKLELVCIPSALNKEELTIIDNTYRIDLYAGCENKNIKKLIFPDSLQVIGNYAFYGYDKLDLVEFRSIKAPTLEDTYNSKAKLEDTAYGYNQLHNQYELFGLDLYYFTFIDLVGKNKPITMVIPNNEDVKGYDGLVYKVYFGGMSKAERSEYTAMEQSLVEFLELAKKIKEKETIRLSDETIINKAISAYNRIKQDPTTYNVDSAYYDSLVDAATQAKAKLVRLKLSKAPMEVQNVQKQIDNLEVEFKVSNLESLKALAAAIASLKTDEKLLLDLTNYNALISSYNSYLESIIETAEPLNNAVNNTFMFVATVQPAMLAVVMFILNKKWM